MLCNCLDSFWSLIRCFVSQHCQEEYFCDFLGDSFIPGQLSVRSCLSITPGEVFGLYLFLDFLSVLCLLATNLIPDAVFCFCYPGSFSSCAVFIFFHHGSFFIWFFIDFCVLCCIFFVVKAASLNPLNGEDFETEDMDYVEIEGEQDFDKLSSLDNKVTPRIACESFLSGDLIIINSLDSDDLLLHDNSTYFYGRFFNNDELTICGLFDALNSLHSNSLFLIRGEKFWNSSIQNYFRALIFIGVNLKFEENAVVVNYVSTVIWS
ncbi:CBK_G0011470.mRNA.1.CDS.1 [Saccharomyces cerevisiae]|nr:CBK_G0011470.mRNA.1.CDS.1 [Saccharomyces cerevisiae]CAI7215440.1 CBK_G0011470.mRNA.1.CDS.1 [Saccharomyces cerevisiae]